MDELYWQIMGSFYNRHKMRQAEEVLKNTALCDVKALQGLQRQKYALCLFIAFNEENVFM